MSRQEEITDISELSRRLLASERKLEELEQSVSYRDAVLAKKASDLHILEQKLSSLADRKEVESLRKPIQEGEAMAIDNSKHIREILSELHRMREHHKLTRDAHDEKIEGHRQDNEERAAILKKHLDKHAADKEKLKQDIASKILHMEIDLTDRMKQIEYQNKLIMKYLKQLDDRLFARKL